MKMPFIPGAFSPSLCPIGHEIFLCNKKLNLTSRSRVDVTENHHRNRLYRNHLGSKRSLHRLVSFFSSSRTQPTSEPLHNEKTFGDCIKMEIGNIARELPKTIRDRIRKQHNRASGRSAPIHSALEEEPITLGNGLIPPTNPTQSRARI